MWQAPSSEAPSTSQPASSPEEARMASLEAAQEPELAVAAEPDSGAGEGAESGETGQPGDTVERAPKETAPQKDSSSDKAAAGEGASSEEEGKPGDVNEAGKASPTAEAAAPQTSPDGGKPAAGKGASPAEAGKAEGANGAGALSLSAAADGVAGTITRLPQCILLSGATICRTIGTSSRSCVILLDVPSHCRGNDGSLSTRDSV